MAFSQNGWRVLEQYGGPLVSKTIPGTDQHFLGGILGGDVDLVLRYVAARWHREVEPIVGEAGVIGLWGYNYRAVRGQSSGFSNHASGTAVDIHSVRHPLGTRTLSSQQKLSLHRIQADLQGAVRFGAFYSGRPDEMHAEVDTDSDRLGAVADLIRRGLLPNVPDELRAGVPEKPSPTEENELNDEEKARLKNIESILGGLQNSIGDPNVGILTTSKEAADRATEAASNALQAIDRAASAEAVGHNIEEILNDIRNGRLGLGQVETSLQEIKDSLGN